MNAVLDPPKVRVRWKLREVMARRRIKNDALASEMGIHKATVSRWKAEDVLPPLGNAEIVAICNAITRLTQDKTLGSCTLFELIGIEEDEVHILNQDNE
jgi:DNA-binding Xre family transcriptional regulator